LVSDWHKTSFTALQRHGSYWGESGFNADIENPERMTQFKTCCGATNTTYFSFIPDAIAAVDRLRSGGMGNIQKRKRTMLLSDPSQRLCCGFQFCLRGALKSLLFA
jgi:hypothetical protein